MDPRSKAIELVRAADALILDFDGPVCDVFAGYPASEVAKELTTQVDFEIVTDDPLEVIRKAIKVGADVDAVDRLLTDLERIAVRTAAETPGARALARSFRGPVAIASNNAVVAIRAWLAAVELTSSFSWIEGRAPRSMKPDPRSLLAVARGIEIDVDDCVFVGDSINDLVAASSARVAFIGLADHDEKVSVFLDHGCEAIIRQLTELDFSG